jgi:hypothetical protein
LKKGTVSPVQLAIRVVPGASKNEVVGLNGGVWKVRLTAPPVEGKANRALVEYLAEKLDIGRSKVGLVKGTASRSKLVAVYGLSIEQIDQRLAK